MKTNKFNKVNKKKKERLFYARKAEAYALARQFITECPELTDTQALTSAYLFSGRSILEATLKLQK